MSNTEPAGNPADGNFTIVRDLLVQTLQLQSGAESLDADSELLGAIPELDSMAVVTILTALEEHFGFYIDDTEMSAETFETLGSLVAFVDQKCAE